MKRFVFFFFIVLSALIAFYHRPLFHFVATHAIHSYTKAGWGAPLEFDELLFREGKLVLTHPRWINEADFTASSLTVGCSFDFWKRDVNLKLEMEEPHWVFSKRVSFRWEKIAKIVGKQGKWIKVYTSLLVKQGTLSFVLPSDHDPKEVYFDAEFNRQQGGEVSLYFGSRDAFVNSLVLNMQRGSLGTNLLCRCNKTELRSLFLLAEFFGLHDKTKAEALFRSALSEGEIMKITPYGSLDGNVQGFFSEDLPPVLAVDLHFPQGNLEGKTDSRGVTTVILSNHVENESGDITFTFYEKEKEDKYLAIEFHHPSPSTFAFLQSVGSMSAPLLSLALPNEKKGTLSVTLDAEVKEIVAWFPGAMQGQIKKQFHADRFQLNVQFRTENNTGDFLGVLMKSEIELMQFGGQLEPFHGWFQARDLSLGTFISPFLFKNSTLHMTGLLECMGTFDKRQIDIAYDTKYLKIEDEDLLIEIQTSLLDSTGKLPGYHIIDLSTHSYKGSLAIKNSSFLEKNKNIQFQETQGTIRFQNHMIRIEPFETVSEGNYFSGQLEVDYRDPSPGVFTLAVHCPIFFGKMFQVKALLAHFGTEGIFHKVPIEGEVFSKNEGLELAFVFSPDRYQLESNVQGMVSEGSFCKEGGEFSLMDLSIPFSYDFGKELLELKDIHGALFIGKSEESEELHFFGKKIRFHPVSHPNIDFDVSVSNSEKELFRLVADVIHESEEIDAIRVDSSLSHFGSIYPDFWECKITKGTSFTLGMRVRELLSLSLAGEWNFDEALLKGSIPFCNLDIALLHSFPLLHNAIEKWSPKGKAQITGAFVWDFFSEDKEKSYIELKALAEEFSFDEYTIATKEPYQMIYKKDGNNSLANEVVTLTSTTDSSSSTLLKQCMVTMKEEKLFCSATSQWERYPYHFIWETNYPSFDAGECLLSGGEGASLLIKWVSEEKEKWKIYSMRGVFGGCSFSLDKKREFSLLHMGTTELEGTLQIDPYNLSPLLPLDSAESIKKWKISSPITIKGDFHLHQMDGKRWFDSFSFQGVFVGEEIAVRGYRFKNLKGDMHYIPGHLDLKNISLDDPAGTMYIPQITFERGKALDKWSFSIPRLTMNNIRFAHLRTSEEGLFSRGKFRFLEIKKMEFQEWTGEWGNEESSHALGNVHFVNTSKKTSFHPLLAIPAEIVLRLGLDPHVLSPVSGIIYFALQGNRMVLSRFKDVYSERRGSKFYLMPNGKPSWIDFDGNISLHIGMKQYNLLFKLAELFSISIEGSVGKPIYSLQRRGKSRKGNTRKHAAIPIDPYLQK